MKEESTVAERSCSSSSSSYHPVIFRDLTGSLVLSSDCLSWTNRHATIDDIDNKKQRGVKKFRLAWGDVGTIQVNAAGRPRALLKLTAARAGNGKKTSCCYLFQFSTRRDLETARNDMRARYKVTSTTKKTLLQEPTKNPALSLQPPAESNKKTPSLPKRQSRQQTRKPNQKDNNKELFKKNKKMPNADSVGRSSSAVAEVLDPQTRSQLEVRAMKLEAAYPTKEKPDSKPQMKKPEQGRSNISNNNSKGSGSNNYCTTTKAERKRTGSRSISESTTTASSSSINSAASTNKKFNKKSIKLASHGSRNRSSACSVTSAAPSPLVIITTTQDVVDDNAILEIVQERAARHVNAHDGDDATNRQALMMILENDLAVDVPKKQTLSSSSTVPTSTEQQRQPTSTAALTTLQRSRNIPIAPRRPGAYAAIPGTDLARATTLEYDSAFNAAASPAVGRPDPDPATEVVDTTGAVGENPGTVQEYSSIVEAHLVAEPSDRELTIQNAIPVPEETIVVPLSDDPLNLPESRQEKNDETIRFWMTREGKLRIILCLLLGLILFFVVAGVAVGVPTGSSSSSSSQECTVSFNNEDSVCLPLLAATATGVVCDCYNFCNGELIGCFDYGQEQTNFCEGQQVVAGCTMDQKAPSGIIPISTVTIVDETDAPSQIQNAVPTLKPTEYPSTDPSPSPSHSPTTEPTDLSIAILAPELVGLRLPVSTVQALRDPSSPQSAGYRWLAQYPQLDSMQSWRKGQLFSLATFCYATQPWISDALGDWLDYGVHECAWVTIPSRTQCTSERYSQLDMDNTGLEGSLPPEISLLTRLELLSLEGNGLQSSFTV